MALHCTKKMAVPATGRLGCWNECAKKASPAPRSAARSLTLVPKMGPSLKSDFLITAPPYAADLFVLSVWHSAFRLPRFLLRVIIQFRSSTSTALHLSSPLPSHWTHMTLHFPPICSVTLHIQAALPTTLHMKSRDSPAMLPPKVTT